LGRYRLFMLSAAWGVWHDQIYGDELQRLPVRLDPHRPATDRLVQAVDALTAQSSPPAADLLGQHRPGQGTPPPAEPLRQIDDAVYELFELSQAERDLVSDFWLRHERARWRTQPAPAPLPIQRFGRAKDLSRDDPSPFARYLAAFLAQWNGQLESHDGELNWRLERDDRVRVVAAVFETQARGAADQEKNGLSSEDWRDALRRLGSGLLHAEQPERRLYRDGIVRAVSDTAIVIVKRDDDRLWTASAAREDAEATLLQAMALSNV
jgi:hypothetical protein